MKTFEAIGRVQLDVFWAHEKNTVSSNLRRMQRDYQDAKLQYSIGNASLPYFPVHEVRDQVGMAGAITMISASLRDRVNCKNLKFASTRRIKPELGICTIRLVGTMEG